MNDLTDPAGIAALSAGALALISLVLWCVLAVRVRRLRGAQQVVLGASGREDLVSHAAGLQEAFVQLNDRVEDMAAQLDERMARAEVGGPHQSSSTTEPRSPESARRTASSSSGESRCSPRPPTTCLQ